MSRSGSREGDHARVLIHAQHLLGAGHLKRAAQIAAALQHRGAEVLLVSGGRPTGGMKLAIEDIFQLPPLSIAGNDFTRLLTEQGEVPDRDWWSRRLARLLEAFDRFRPDVLVTELYPFGRRGLRQEYQALLEHAQRQIRRVKIVCSVRDILQTGRKPERIAEVLDNLQRYYALVLVHGDEHLVPFSETFPAAAEIADKLAYTGYICEYRMPISQPLGDEILISGGASGAAKKLFDCALSLYREGCYASYRWRLVMNPELIDHHYQHWLEGEESGLVVEPLRGDFFDLLSRSRLSISQAGYNTFLEVLLSRRPAVMIPYEGLGETEQLTRTRRLADAGRVTMLREKTLDPIALKQAIDQALATEVEDWPLPSLNGADQAADRIIALNRHGA